MTDFIESGKRTIQMETDAVRELSSRIGFVNSYASYIIEARRMQPRGKRFFEVW